MSKRIVVFCDGTWKTPDDRNITNVVKLMRSVETTARDGTSQVTFYDPGVGTESPVRRLFGGAFGVGLSQNVRDGYRFIANNYETGDEIYLFGFSRGAYTARSLGGLITDLGVFFKHEMGRFDEACDAYEESEAPLSENSELSAKFARLREYQHALPKIKFIGVWDTVGALGIPVGLLDRLAAKLYDFKKFHDTGLNTNISHAYHAVAIDERRGPFQATLWESARQNDVETVEQVWFCGVHSNVGGGYPDDGLENCALHWMAAKAGKHGLDLNGDHLSRFEANPAGELYDSRTWMYRTSKAKVRDVDWTGYAGAAIHESVLQRLQQVPAYRPKNVLAGLKAHPVVNTEGETVRPPGPYSD